MNIFQFSFARIGALAFCLSGFLLPVLAAAQVAPDLPAIAKKSLDETIKDCPAKAVMKPGFLTRMDINEDGRPDYIFNFEHYECGDMVGLFCGSAGCNLEVFASLPDGQYVQVYNDN